MLRDLLDDVAVGIAVAVRVLEGVVHRLHHRLGRPVRVLVARKLRERVVLLHRRAARRGLRAGHLIAPLRQQIGGTNLEISDGCRDHPDESAPGDSVLHTHRSLRSDVFYAGSSGKSYRSRSLAARAAGGTSSWSG